MTVLLLLLTLFTIAIIQPVAATEPLKIAVFYRRSDVPLEGDRSPATTQMELRNLPGGDYDVSAVVIDSSGNERAVAHARAMVMSPTHDPMPGSQPR
jgi:hypothetical protein